MKIKVTIFIVVVVVFIQCSFASGGKKEEVELRITSKETVYSEAEFISELKNKRITGITLRKNYFPKNSLRNINKYMVERNSLKYLELFDVGKAGFRQKDLKEILLKNKESLVHFRYWVRSSREADKNINDEFLTNVMLKLKNLTVFSITTEYVTDKGLGYLLDNLDVDKITGIHLWYDRSKRFEDDINIITDKSIIKIKRFKNLDSLTLTTWFSHVSEETVIEIIKDKKLEYLGLRDKANITDNIIESLIKHKNHLETLLLYRTDISKEGYGRLKVGLPNTHVSPPDPSYDD